MLIEAMASILVVSNEGTDSKAFCQQLTGHHSAFKWHISTKYYDVDVTLDTATDSQLSQNNTCREYEAVLIITQSTAIESFDEFQKWFSNWRRLKGTLCPISLIIIDMPTDSEINEGSDQEIHEWAAENNFEVITICTSDLRQDKNLEEFGQGMQRVREALEAHVWPGCTLKKQQQSVQEPGHSFDPFSEDATDNFEQLIVQMTSTLCRPDLFDR